MTETEETTSITTEAKRQWGGPRDNSGRKPTLHNPVKKMVRLEEGQMAMLLEWSEERNINLNAAIRQMIEFAHQSKIDLREDETGTGVEWEDSDPSKEGDPSDPIVEKMEAEEEKMEAAKSAGDDEEWVEESADLDAIEEDTPF